jgi:hypothetical protein
MFFLRCHARKLQEIDMPKEIYYARVEPVEGMHYIVVTEGILEEDIEALCDKYFEKHKEMVRVVQGQALLVDLRGNEPRFECVPRDYKLPEDPR